MLVPCGFKNKRRVDPKNKKAYDSSRLVILSLSSKLYSNIVKVHKNA